MAHKKLNQSRCLISVIRAAESLPPTSLRVFVLSLISLHDKSQDSLKTHSHTLPHTYVHMYVSPFIQANVNTATTKAEMLGQKQKVVTKKKTPEESNNEGKYASDKRQSGCDRYLA